MRTYPITDAVNPWNHVFLFDRANRGVSTVSVGNLLKLLPETAASTGSGVAWEDVAGKPVTFTPSNHSHGIEDVTGLQTALDGKQLAGSYIASSAIGTTVQAFNAGTVIDAGYVHTDNNFTAAHASKLAGIATGATVNSSDATLINRANHTGTQAQATITSLTTDLAAKQPLDGDLTALAALNGTNTIYYRAGEDTWSPVTIGSNVTFAGGVLSATGGGGGGSPILSWAI